MTRTIYALLVAVAVVLGGCAGATASLDATTAETATATTTAANGTATNATTADATAEPAEATAQLPPGVFEDGVSNATALLAAHRETLAETSYAFEGRSNYSIGGLSAAGEQSGTVAKGFFPHASNANTTLRRGNRTVEYDVDRWANESVTLVRYRTENRIRYQKLFHENDEQRSPGPELGSPLPNRSEVEASISGTTLIAAALRTGNFTVESVEMVDGRTVTTLRAREANRSSDLGSANVTRYDAMLVVDERGVVREANFSLAFESRYSGQNAMTYRFEAVRIGPVVVSRPAWSDEALATTSVQVSVDAAETYFVVANRGGDPLPAGSEIRVSHDDVNATLTVEQPLRPGERAYVYFPADGGEPALTRERPAEGTGAQVQGDYEFTVVDPTGNVFGQFGIGRSVSTTTPVPVTAPENETTTTDG
jgi:hypothetical protein